MELEPGKIVNLKEGEEIIKCPEPDWKEAYYTLSSIINSAIEVSNTTDNLRLDKIKKILDKAVPVMKALSISRAMYFIQVKTKGNHG
jgi:hypothetical protein